MTLACAACDALNSAACWAARSRCTSPFSDVRRLCRSPRRTSIARRSCVRSATSRPTWAPLGREPGPAVEDRGLEMDDLRRNLDVERRDLVRGVDPGHDLREVLRAEDDLERGGLPCRVQLHEPDRDRPPALREVALRDHELPAVHRDLLPNVGKLQVREVDELVGAAEARVQIVDLTDDLLCLGLRGGDRRGGRSRGLGGREESCNEQEQHVRRKPPPRGKRCLRDLRGSAHRVGPARHEGRTLAIWADTSNPDPPRSY